MSYFIYWCVMLPFSGYFLHFSLECIIYFISLQQIASVVNALGFVVTLPTYHNVWQFFRVGYRLFVWYSGERSLTGIGHRSLVFYSKCNCISNIISCIFFDATVLRFLLWLGRNSLLVGGHHRLFLIWGIGLCHSISLLHGWRWVWIPVSNLFLRFGHGLVPIFYHHLV